MAPKWFDDLDYMGRAVEVVKIMDLTRLTHVGFLRIDPFTSRSEIV